MVFNNLPPRSVQPPEITPFTYPDGITNMEILRHFKRWIDHIEKNVANALEGFGSDVNNELAALRSDVEAALTSSKDYTDDEVAAMVAYVDDAVQQIINSSIEVQDPVIAGILGDKTSASRQELDELYTNMEQVQNTSGTISTLDLIPDNPDEAAHNTNVIQELLDNPEFLEVVLPAGHFYVTSITIPINKSLTGAFSRMYVTVPNTGTRLQCAIDEQTLPVIQMTSRSMLTKIGVFGSGENAQHSAVQLLQNGAIIRDCAIGFAQVGIDGNYGLGIIDNCHIYHNDTGILNILDGKVYFCTLNVNRTNGINAQAGANNTEYVGNRIEWNTGVGFNIFNANQLTVTGNVFDRNGSLGLRCVGSGNSIIGDNKFWRNGKLAEGESSNDAHVFFQSTDGCTFVGNTTRQGQDDGGGGYVSPVTALRLQDNDGLVLVGNDLRGATERSVINVAASTNTKQIANVLRAGEYERFYGDVKQDRLAMNIPPSDVATVELPLPAIAQYQGGNIYKLSISLRTQSGTAGSATVNVSVARPHTTATIVFGEVQNIQGDLIGTSDKSFNLSGTVNSDGSLASLSVSNTTSSQVFVQIIVE